MKSHICIESHTCICGITADEPNEHCPVHGAGEWPPRCAICGQFIRREPVEMCADEIQLRRTDD